MYQFQCPHCGGVFQILPTMAGQPVACPHCNGQLIVPGMANESASPGGAGPLQESFAEPPIVSPPGSPWQGTRGTSPEMVEPPPVIGRSEPPQQSAWPPLSSAPAERDASLQPLYHSTAREPEIEAPPVASGVLLPPGNPAPLEAAESEQAPTADRLLVIPTREGGQAVIREPTKVAVSGSRRRELRALDAEERTVRRSLKNAVLWLICAIVLFTVFWVLLRSGPL